LDTGPAENGKTVQAGHIWCEKASIIDVELEPDINQWSANSALVVEVVDSQDKVMATKHYTTESKRDHLKTEADISGWFTLRLSGRSLPAPATYALTVIYTGTQEMAVR
jgi:hypothetical protein